MKHAVGSIMLNGQLSAVVQAKTKKRMVELINEHGDGFTSMNHFNDYWMPGNHEKIKEHFGDEEGLWVCEDTPKQFDYSCYRKIDK